MQTYWKKGRITRKLTRDRKRKPAPKVPHPKTPKKIFSIQKVEEEEKEEVVGEAKEPSPQLRPQPQPPPQNESSDFSFKSYQFAIANEYNEHFENQLRNLQHFRDRALPIPDFSNKNGRANN